MQLGQVITGAFLTCVALSPLVFQPKHTLLPLFGDRVNVKMVSSGGDGRVAYGSHQQYIFDYKGETRQFEIAYARPEARSRIGQIYVWPDDPETYGPVWSEETWMGILIMISTLPFGVPVLVIGLFGKKKKNETKGEC